MTRAEAIQTIESAGVAVWQCEGKKPRVYGLGGSWCYITRDSADSAWRLELGTKSSWRNLDKQVSAAESALAAANG